MAAVNIRVKRLITSALSEHVGPFKDSILFILLKGSLECTDVHFD